VSSLFFSLNLLAVWLPGGLPLTLQDPRQLLNAQLLASARYGLALAVPLIYFNLKWIKPLFRIQQGDEPARTHDQFDR
jgi:hypothetical protein